MFNKIGDVWVDKTFWGSARIGADDIGQRVDAVGRNKKAGLATWLVSDNEVVMRSIRNSKRR